MDIPGTKAKTRLLPYLFSGYRPFVIMVLHSIITAVLFRSHIGLAVLLPWLLNLIAVQEPKAPTAARHEDVAEFMNSDAGRLLSRRRFWVPEKEKIWVVPLACVLLLIPGAVVGFVKTGADQTGLQVMRAVIIHAWAGIPIVVTAAYLMETMLQIPIVYGPLILFYVVFFVLFIVQGKEEHIIRFSLVIPAVILPLYSLDLLRLLRRSWYTSER